MWHLTIDWILVWGANNALKGILGHLMGLEHKHVRWKYDTNVKFTGAENCTVVILKIVIITSSSIITLIMTICWTHTLLKALCVLFPSIHTKHTERDNRVELCPCKRFPMWISLGLQPADYRIQTSESISVVKCSLILLENEFCPSKLSTSGWTWCNQGERLRRVCLLSCEVGSWERVRKTLSEDVFP